MNILFDTGQSDVYRINAERMAVDLGKVDCIVLSHGHYDHCGGLIHFPALHCTGILAITEMRRLMGDRCLMLCAGDSLEL